MESFEFPKSILERAQTITLQELLDSPISQCWIVSALSNASRARFYHAKEMTPQDEVLEFKIGKLLELIPYEERKELFTACSQEVAMRKERQNTMNPVKTETTTVIK